MKKQAIILGGGTSVLEGIHTGLFNKIRNKFTVGLNFSHHYFPSTLLMYVDETFVQSQKPHLNNLPLVIGKECSGVTLSDNHYHFPTCPDYTRDCHKGIYKSTLVGLFALSFLIYVMDEGDIFLLGYDYGATYSRSGKPITHWYQSGQIESIYTGKPENIPHRGIGKVNWYEALHRDSTNSKPIPRAEHEFGVYGSESKIRIYNVSPASKISTFPKINYEQFYQMLDAQSCDQDALRQEVRLKANELLRVQQG
jgi:hypothetical protein